MYWMTVFILFSISYAQLTSPDEAVCEGQQVVFVCQQPSGTVWTVTLTSGSVLRRIVSSSDTGTVVTFTKDPGFGFEIHVLLSSSTSSVISELHVTAVRQLNGVTVECTGDGGTFMSTIQIASVASPATPNGVMTTANERQFTPSTASITVTWSASSGSDNYTIMVTPLLPSGQSLVSTTTTSLQLTVLYNENYSINITAQNCAGSNSTIVPLTMIVGCSPPFPPANGSISEYSSGAVGAMLTFQCDNGYMPLGDGTSTCLSNSSWVPLPECEVPDCGFPFVTTGVTVEPFNNTKFYSSITFHCDGSNITTLTAICDSNGEWVPNPASLKCGNQSLGTSPEVMSTLSLSTGEQVLITAIICSLVCFILGVLVGVLSYHLSIVKCSKIPSSSPASPAASAPVVYEEVSHIEKGNIELKESVAYGPISH